jgi:hypothetical protein
MRPTLFWDVTRRGLVVIYRRKKQKIIDTNNRCKNKEKQKKLQ